MDKKIEELAEEILTERKMLLHFFEEDKIKNELRRLSDKELEDIINGKESL